jgi:flagellar basal-body rod protein FlgB
MPSLDNSLGINLHALRVADRRNELIAGNLANADTPNYKARDLDFRAVLSQAAGESLGPQRTHSRHMVSSAGDMSQDPLFREPFQASIDGNTVDPQLEKTAFMENTVRYQATVNFIDSRISSLRKAFKGN